MFFERLFWNSKTRTLVLRILSHLPIVKGRVVCICWGGTKYNCNPRAITDTMIKMGLVSGDKSGQFEVTYVFVDPSQYEHELSHGIGSVEIGSLKYFYNLATSQFIIANTRFGGGLFWAFKKRKGQYYIQTMHGGHGMKKQELEVSDSLGKDYIRGLYEDASRIDLMISDSKFWTEKARTIFAYPEGDILEVGLPRNDVFFSSTESKNSIKRDICKKINVTYSDELKFLVYCPTFRSNGRKDVYGFDPDQIISALANRFGGDWYILVSSHPNMRSYYHEIYDFSNPHLVDVGHEDLQPILVSSDAAITDYSSAGFEFALTGNPCFLLCRDLDDYDRGVYFDMKSLPFPYAETDDQLVSNIMNFDNEKYQAELEQFNREVIGLNETGHASEAVVEWMINKLN